MFSLSENLINISSWVVAVPTVVSVPKCIKCLVVGDIKVNLDAVGLLPVAKFVVSKAALVVKGVVDEGFHVKVLLLATVATNTSPKLSKDQRPGSKFTWPAFTASPQAL